jgi:hypothetical protein
MEKSLKTDWRGALTQARRHILVQGEIVYATAILQDRFYHTFSVALSLERPDEFGAEIRFHDHALEIWHTISSDYQQRDMALNALTSVPTKLKLLPAINRIKWARTQATKLAEYRNLVAHNPVMFRADWSPEKDLHWIASFGGHSLRRTHRERLKFIKTLSFWRTLRDDLLKLSDYVGAVNDQVRRLDAESRGAEWVGVPTAWPGRPKLRSLPRILEIARTLGSATPKPRRRNQRRPSPRSRRS